MVFIVPVLVLISLIGIRFQKNNSTDNTYLSKQTTNCVRGFFIILIVAVGFLNLIPASSINNFDAPLSILSLGGMSFGGLLFVPFFFYSGYGIFETYKEKGKKYARRIPLQQILRHYLSYFIAWIFFAIAALALKSPYSISDYLLSAIGLSEIGNENWFVFVMLFMYLFSYIGIRVADKKTAVIINIVLALFFLFLMINFDVPKFCWNTTFAYLFGIVYSYLKERIEKWLFSKKFNRLIILAVSTALFIGSIALLYYAPDNTFMSFMFAFPTFFLCVTILSFTSIVKLRSRLLNFVGQNSFWIYILYPLPFIIFKNIYAIYSHKYVYFMLGALAAVVMAIILNKVFNYLWNIFAKNHGEASEESNMKVGVAISYTTLVVSVLGAFVVTPRIVEYLGYGNYGLLSFANSITAWLAVISSALAASYMRFASKQKKEGGDVGVVNTSYLKIFGILAIGIVLVIVGVVMVFLVFNIQLSQYTDSQNKAILYLILISGINVAINVMYSIFYSFLSYKKQFIFLRLTVLIISFLTFACNLIFAFVTKSVLSISIVSMVMTALSTVMTLFFALRKEKMTFPKTKMKETSPLIKSIIIFSSFILLDSIVDQINVNLDKTILGLMVNETAVADYTFAKYFSTYFMILALAINQTHTPKIHEMVANEDKESLRQLFLKISSSQMIILFLVGGGYVAVGEEFMSIWLGADKAYIYFYALLPIIMDLFVLSASSSIEIQRAMNRHKFRAVLYVSMAVVNIGVSILMIKVLPAGYEVWGVFIGTVFTTVVGNIILLDIYNKVTIGLPMGKYFWHILKHIFYAGAGVGVALAIKYLLISELEAPAKLVIQGAIFIVIYFALLLVFERSTLLPLIKKIFGKAKMMVKGGAEK